MKISKVASSHAGFIALVSLKLMMRVHLVLFYFIRGIHIIPAFAYSTTDELLGESIAQVYTDVDAAGSDWKYYYVNM